jgi:hypothetical protein
MQDIDHTVIQPAGFPGYSEEYPQHSATGRAIRYELNAQGAWVPRQRGHRGGRADRPAKVRQWERAGWESHWSATPAPEAASGSSAWDNWSSAPEAASGSGAWTDWSSAQAPQPAAPRTPPPAAARRADASLPSDLQDRIIELQAKAEERRLDAVQAQAEHEHAQSILDAALEAALTESRLKEAAQRHSELQVVARDREESRAAREELAAEEKRIGAEELRAHFTAEAAVPKPRARAKRSRSNKISTGHRHHLSFGYRQPESESDSAPDAEASATASGSRGPLAEGSRSTDWEPRECPDGWKAEYEDWCGTQSYHPLLPSSLPVPPAAGQRRPVITVDWHKTIEQFGTVQPVHRFALVALARYFTVLVLSFVGGGPGSARHISTFRHIVESGVNSLLLRSRPDAIWAPFRGLPSARSAAVHFTFNRSEADQRQSRDSAGRLFPTKLAYVRLIGERCGSGPVSCHIDDCESVIVDLRESGFDSRLVKTRHNGAGDSFQRIVADLIWKHYPRA